MSKRAYPQDPSVPIHSTIPPGVGGTNFPGQGPYPGQPGPPSGAQPLGGGGYPRQQYPPPGHPNQGWGAPSTSAPSGYGPPHPPGPTGGGHGYQPPPSTLTYAGPPPSHSTGGVVRGPPAPPTSVSTLTSGVTNMHIGPTGAHGPRPQMMPTVTRSSNAPPPPAGHGYSTSYQPPPPPTSSRQPPPVSAPTGPPPTGPVQPPTSLGGAGTHPDQPPSTSTAVSGLYIPPNAGGWGGKLMTPPIATSSRSINFSARSSDRPVHPPPQPGGHIAVGSSDNVPITRPPLNLSNASVTGITPLGLSEPKPDQPPSTSTAVSGLYIPPNTGGWGVHSSSGPVHPPPQPVQPPPTSGGLYTGPGAPTGLSGGSLHQPPPPTSGGLYTGPGAPTGSSGGSLYHPPPPTGPVPPSGGVGPPPPRQIPPPPTSSHGYPGQHPGGLMSAPSGPRPPTAPMSRSGPGVPPPTPPYSQPGGMAQSDPNLQPVNLMESRHIVPSSPIVPPAIALPNNMSKFVPDHKVFCCTMNAVPATSSLLNKLKLPFAIHIHPYRDMTQNECPVIHPNVIVRCRMCRAYINPYVTFIDSRHWRCNLCFRPNTLPEDFDYNPHSGKHGDRSHRVELRRSCVEFIAPSEYMVRPPQPCVFYFLIDVSFNAVQTGLLGVFCKCLLENLDRLPGDARTMVGILTYDSSLHFYNLNSDLSQPQMLVVSDVDDVFLPCPDSLLVTLKDSKELVRTLLEDLPRMFADNKSVHSALGPALQAATKLLHPIGGRVTVLQTSIPNVGPGALKYRDVSPSATKIDTLSMSPASDFYKKLALDCSSQQIGVDLFAFGAQFMDLSTISCISKFSSGQVSYYPDFHHKREVPRVKFEKDFRRYLTRKIGFEAVMRIRCTDGLSLHTFHGNFFVRSTDLLSLPNVNPDHGFTMNLAIDESLKDVSMACFQAALLYTSSRGERRIRVHTLSLPVSSQLSDIYAKLNIQAIAGVLGNMAVDRASSSSLGDAREALLNIVIDATKMYRSNFASSMQASQLTLPATLRLLPLFMISLLKNPAFSLNSKVSYDFRAQAMNLIKSTPLDYLTCLLYPRLYALHMLTENQCMIEREDGKEELAPPILQLSSENMTRYGIFLMDYGLGLYIWVSKDAPQALIQKIFGVPHFGAIPEIMTSLPQEENDISPLVNKLIKQIRASRQIYMPLQVIREDGPHRLLFIDKMIDDRTDYGTSYYEFLTHVSRQLSK